MDILSDFSRRVRELRCAQSLRQDDVAEYLGTSKQVISNYENGQREPSFDIVIKLAHYFTVSTDYLLGASTFKSASEENSFRLPTSDIDIAALQLYRKSKALFDKLAQHYKENNLFLTLPSDKDTLRSSCFMEILRVLDRFENVIEGIQNNADVSEIITDMLESRKHDDITNDVVAEIFRVLK